MRWGHLRLELLLFGNQGLGDTTALLLLIVVEGTVESPLLGYPHVAASARFLLRSRNLILTVDLSLLLNRRMLKLRVVILSSSLIKSSLTDHLLSI